MDTRHVAWNVAHGLTWAAARTPGKIAVREGSRAFTYRELNARVNRLAHALVGLGLRAGDRFLLLVSDRVEHLETLFACAKVGVVAAPVDHRWRPEELRHAIALYEPRAVLFEEATRAMVPATLAGPRVCLETEYETLLATAGATEALQPVAAEAPFVIGSTSGTSGLPKGIVLSHRSMLWRMPIYAFDFGFGPDDVWLSNTPMAQGGGRAFAMATWIRGGTVLIDPDFDPERTLATIAREQVTTCFMVPTMFGRILAASGLAAADTSSLRCVISTGAPLSPTMRVEILDRFTPNLYQFYSSTESGGIAVLPPWMQRDKGDSVGVGVFGKEMRVAEDGEVLSRGPAVMTEYFRNPEATAAAFDGDWFRTGDTGRPDQDGFLYIVGRKKEMIITGGLNVYPAEVERVLHLHPAVQEAAVVGGPDAEWGEIVKAFVQLRAGHAATEADIVEHCRAHMASYKKPKVVEFLPELPRTSNGKIAKNLLRERGRP
ncbi:MAG: AMP-binding protein [Candidatus Rokubacteria bacterium]|nr:AMP-binding protein [Candidatus Rokubacteria bacterium]